MAGGAAFGRLTRTIVMFRVIEYSVESLFELYRKGFDRRIVRIQIVVATNANCLLRGDPFVHMASDTRFVSAEPAVDALWFARMAGITFKLGMFGNLM